MNINELSKNHYAFGGKGDVWSNTAHIAKSGEYNTLCSRPMLSTNWVHINGVETIGCTTCLAKYKASMMGGYGDESMEEVERMIASVNLK
jgi:hypothetical protein